MTLELDFRSQASEISHEVFALYYFNFRQLFWLQAYDHLRTIFGVGRMGKKEVGTMVFCVFVVNSVLAKPHSDLGKAGMEHIDSNGDGKLSLEEFQNKNLGPFYRLDEDGDGLIYWHELQAHYMKVKEKMRKKFDRADANGDGLVSGDEIVAAQTREFNRMDRNGDNSLSRREFIYAHKRRLSHVRENKRESYDARDKKLL